MKSRVFHFRMGLLLAAFIAATLITGAVTGIHVPHPASLVVAFVAVAAALCPLPAYAHQTGRLHLRESLLALLWALAFAVTLPLSVVSLASFAFPLQDAYLASFDKALGISVPAIVAWAGRHSIGHVLGDSYGLLIPWLPIATLAVGISGQWIRARVFVAANALAFAIGLPLFALFPAIGPWYHATIVPNDFQLQCQNSLLAIRSGGSPDVVAIVCFPSFHVIWAVLCAYAFWGFRWLRIPASILAAMIILSTITTGWHYFADVLAGLAISGVALRLAPRIAVPDAVTASPAGAELAAGTALTTSSV